MHGMRARLVAVRGIEATGVICVHRVSGRIKNNRVKSRSLVRAKGWGVGRGWGMGRDTQHRRNTGVAA